MKTNKLIILLGLFAVITLFGCGVYSLTGAAIAGKTLTIHNLENSSANVVPTLTATLTEKIRNRILSQTGLTPVQENADYDITGSITQYAVSISGVGDVTTATASQNRLTITVSVEFKNKLDEKKNFNQSFSRFADFPANQQLVNVENKLIQQIGEELADDIFNKAFVNW